MSDLWLHSELKEKIFVGSHGSIACTGGIREARYRCTQSGRFDGVHLYGSSGMKTYTNSVLEILKNAALTTSDCQSCPQFEYQDKSSGSGEARQCYSWVQDRDVRYKNTRSGTNEKPSLNVAGVNQNQFTRYTPSNRYEALSDTYQGNFCGVGYTHPPLSPLPPPLSTPYSQNNIQQLDGNITLESDISESQGHNIPTHLGNRPEKSQVTRLPPIRKRIRRDNRAIQALTLPIVLNYNMRSLFSKIQNFSEDMLERQGDIAFLTEIWQKQENKKHQSKLEKMFQEKMFQMSGIHYISLKSGF